MFLTEDGISSWVYLQGGLCITRKIYNLDGYDLKRNDDFLVVLTGYKKIIETFYETILPNIRSRIVLILIESDIIELEIEHLEHEKVKFCFSWNVKLSHPKLHPLPIGLNADRHLNSIERWLHVERMTTTRYAPLAEKLLCFNCNLNTGYERLKLATVVKEKMQGYCDSLPYRPPIKSFLSKSYTDGTIKVDVTDPACYSDWKSYKFILSPEGAGIDCHRTWEAMIVGCIPIVRSSHLNLIYRGLPVLVLDDWDRISPDFLSTVYSEINSSTLLVSDRPRLTHSALSLEYWRARISAVLKGGNFHFARDSYKGKL